MAEEVLTQAESSPAVEVDPFNGQTPSLQEYNQYRTSGEVPERFKPAEEAEPAPAEPAEGEEPENETESASENDQEPPEGIGNKSRRRFEKLLAENKALKAAQQAKPDVTPVPSAAPQVAQIAPTRPEPTVNDQNVDGTLKYADYSDFIKDLGKWSAEQTLHESRQREVQQQQTRQIQESIERDRTRYGDEYERVLEPTAGTINSSKSLHSAVKEAIGTSDVMADLIYTLGTDQKTMKELEKLSMSNPVQAIKYIGILEAGIRQELAADASEPAEHAPEPKQTKAPKPPVPVAGPSSRAFDVSDESLSAEDWARKRNADLARRRSS